MENTIQIEEEYVMNNPDENLDKLDEYGIYTIREILELQRLECMICDNNRLKT